MKSLRRACSIAVGVLIASPAIANAQQARNLSFQQTIELAVKGSPDLAISAKSVRAARHKTRASKALRLPKVSLDANVFLWNDALEFEFSIPGMDPPADQPPVTVRDRVTSTVSVNVVEPLSSQPVIGRLIEIDELGVEAAKHDQDHATDAIAFAAARGYIGLLQARAAIDIAESSVKQVEAQLERAKVLKDGGVLESVDVMRLEAARAAARQQRIQARKATLLAEANLVLVLGLPSGTEIVAADTFPEAPKLYALRKGDAIAVAVRDRADLKASRARVEVAKGGADIAKSYLFPNLAAIGTYQHNEGGGTFQPKDAWFVGLTLQWDVWDWGYNWNNYQQAKVQANQAQLATERAADRVAVEVQSLGLDVEASYEGLDAARSGLAAAEEAFRIQSERYSEGKGTTTDLLDAETEVTRARLSLSSARYAYFAALVSLANGMGVMPTDVFEQI